MMMAAGALADTAPVKMEVPLEAIETQAEGELETYDLTFPEDMPLAARNFVLFARAEFEKVFGAEAKCCGAPGWQISPAALEVEDAANLLYASDVRGEFPFIPKMGGRTFKTIQIPSTLPTLDEVLGTVKIGEVAEMHFAAMREREYSVLTAHAELEGMAYLEWFDKFISEARGRGVEFYPLEARARELSANRSQLPVCEIEMSPFPGRSGLLAVQKPQTQAPR